MMIRRLKSTNDFVCFLDSFFPQKVACKHCHWTMVAIYIYMFDDIKTWLNPTGILFQWAGSLRQSSSLTEVRWVVQWPPLLVSPPMLVSPIPTLWGPIPGT